MNTRQRALNSDSEEEKSLSSGRGADPTPDQHSQVRLISSSYPHFYLFYI